MGSEGHFFRMFDPYAYPFHEGLRRDYGRVARICGFFGVCLASQCPRPLSSLMINIIVRAGHTACGI
jgi:hypothetical protein